MRFLAMLLLVVLAVWTYSAFKYAWQHSRAGRKQFAVMVLLGYVLSAADATFRLDTLLRELSQKIRQMIK